MTASMSADPITSKWGFRHISRGKAPAGLKCTLWSMWFASFPANATKRRICGPKDWWGNTPSNRLGEAPTLDPPYPRKRSNSSRRRSDTTKTSASSAVRPTISSATAPREVHSSKSPNFSWGGLLLKFSEIPPDKSSGINTEVWEIRL